eukprot:scaffold5105_cov103-Isochrysis_galbana.AAC.1
MTNTRGVSTGPLAGSSDKSDTLLSSYSVKSVGEAAAGAGSTPLSRHDTSHWRARPVAGDWIESAVGLSVVIGRSTVVAEPVELTDRKAHMAPLSPGYGNPLPPITSGTDCDAGAAHWLMPVTMALCATKLRTQLRATGVWEARLGADGHGAVGADVARRIRIEIGAEAAANVACIRGAKGALESDLVRRAVVAAVR